MANPTNTNAQEKAILVGLVYGKQTAEKVDEYLDELAFLAKTAGAKVLQKFVQKRSTPNVKTFVGKGKLEEIKTYCELKDIQVVIFDDELSPSQQNNLEKKLEVKIVDRPFLILDIFASRAKTAQAKAQVELAQMQYLLPRLRGMWTHLDRIKGGIGMRGTGEKEIETDRRIVNTKITKLKKQLESIDKRNITMRNRRDELIRVALVGYTNVGKSTLMNVLSKSDLFAEDKLFATLDTTVRKIVLDRTPFLLSDTVGFIRKLPHQLVESFKSTLAETLESDILLHVVDVAHPQFQDHINVVNIILKELGAAEKPQIIILNKLDLFEQLHFDELVDTEGRDEILNGIENQFRQLPNTKVIFISAQEKRNITELRELVLSLVKEQYAIRYPYKTMFF